VTTLAADARQEAFRRIVRGFAGGDRSRSVAVASLRGGTIGVAVAADVPRPAASLLKIPLVAAVHASGLDLESSVARSELGSTRFGTVLAAFGPDHRFTLRELCALTLVASDNLAAEHLLALVGLDAVNRMAAELAGPGTRLEVGFSDACLGTDGLVNVTTAREALRMIRAVVEEPRHAELAAALRNGIRNPRIPLRLPQLRVAAKSGTLYGVVNDVGVLFGAENDLAVAFLCEQQPDRERTGLEIGDCAAELWAALDDPAGSVRRA
jgi:beta-lactamase class A